MLVKHGLLPANALNALVGPVGHKNVAVDLNGVASLLRENWARLDGKTPLTIADLDAATRVAVRQRDLAARQGLTLWSLISSLHFSTSAYSAGDDQAVHQALMTVGMLRAIGMEVWVPSFLGVIAAVQLDRGDHAGAEANVRDALAAAASMGAHYWTPELRRVLGEARLGQGDPSGIEDLRAAVELAVRQHARLHELWARTSVCRAGGHDEDRAELRALLAELPLPADAPARLAAEAVLAG
jgi:hypothetical protein